LNEGSHNKEKMNAKIYLGKHPIFIF